MHYIGATSFEGNRVTELLSRYRSLHNTFLSWPSAIIGFSRELSTTANTFEHADQSSR